MELQAQQEQSALQQEELQQATLRLQGLQEDLLGLQERSRQALGELTAREEELVLHKLEVASLQEKLRSKNDEVSEALVVAMFGQRNPQVLTENTPSSSVGTDKKPANCEREPELHFSCSQGCFRNFH